MGVVVLLWGIRDLDCESMRGTYMHSNGAVRTEGRNSLLMFIIVIFMRVIPVQNWEREQGEEDT